MLRGVDGQLKAFVGLLDLWRWDRSVVTETSGTDDLRCATSRKSEDFKKNMFRCYPGFSVILPKLTWFRKTPGPSHCVIRSDSYHSTLSTRCTQLACCQVYYCGTRIYHQITHIDRYTDVMLNNVQYLTFASCSGGPTSDTSMSMWDLW